MSDIKAKNAPNSISAGAPPQIPWGAYSAPPDPLAGFKGPTSKGREGKAMEWDSKGKGMGGKEGRSGEREENEGAPIEMMDPLTKILNTPMVLFMSSKTI